MLRSLYSGISGMKVNQTKMDVIGNNIANVGTTAFKAGRVRFQDMLSQSVSEAMAPTSSQGGVNASQVGLGVQLAGIDTIVDQGEMQSTGRNLDLGIDGDGFFMVGKGPSVFGDNTLGVNQASGAHTVSGESLTSTNMDLMYTREGSFTLDNDGNLLTSDGYRVMGYSLTNDSTTQSASAVQPNAVNVGGFDFRFGPGSALNGYSVVLGAVGPDTVTSAAVDKNSKIITLNGDFSSSNGISNTEAKTAINNALSSAGISQTVAITGTPKVINNIYSNKVAGGADAVAPGNVAVGGLTFSFGQGSMLNGYSVVLGNVGPGQGLPTATTDTTKKQIIINGNFTDQGAVTSDQIQKAVNNATGLPSGATITITGTPANFAPSDNVSGGVSPKSPIASTSNNNTIVLGGLTFTLGQTSVFNNKTITMVPDTTLGTTAGSTSNIALSGSAINIKYNPNATAATVATDVANALNSALNLNTASTQTAVSATGALATSNTSYPGTISGGADASAAATLNFKGLKFTFNYDATTPNNFEKLNNYNIALGNMAPGTAEAAHVSGNTIVIDGDFTNPSAINTGALASAIKTALGTNILGTNGTVSIAGTPALVNGTISSSIDGGTDLKAPTNTPSVAGLSMTLSPGSQLNGYTFQLGTITNGTTTSATVDTTNKKIIINGDFATQGAITSNAIRSAINNALSAKGITNQYVSSIAGSPITITNIQSATANGGTPVQSINGDGTIDFVDGTKDIKSYDGSLKTLKIPDKVRVAGSDSDLKVKTFSISKDGIITAVLEDGSVAALGQIAMAGFKNPAGLTKLGKNLYHQSVNSGEATVKSGMGTTGEDNSKGFGDMQQGMVEMSNVDLAAQFTDMIVTTRAFQASSKMISTGDEILQDIINLKR